MYKEYCKRSFSPSCLSPTFLPQAVYVISFLYILPDRYMQASMYIYFSLFLYKWQHTIHTVSCVFFNLTLNHEDFSIPEFKGKSHSFFIPSYNSVQFYNCSKIYLTGSLMDLYLVFKSFVFTNNTTKNNLIKCNFTSVQVYILYVCIFIPLLSLVSSEPFFLFFQI